MRDDQAVQASVLRKLEAAEYPILFEQFYRHPDAGFEQSLTPEWSAKESYAIKMLIERGLVRLSATNGDEPWLDDPAPDRVYRETYCHITAAGHDYLKSVGFSGWMRVQFIALRRNILTIIVSVLTTLAAA